MGNQALLPAQEPSSVAAASAPACAPQPYPSTCPLPLPASHSGSSSSIYLTASHCLTDFHIAKVEALLAASSLPVEHDDWTPTACSVCDFTPAAASARLPQPGESSRAAPYMAHAVCRLKVKMVNTMMAATDATHLVLLMQAEGRWSAAITSRLQAEGPEEQRTETVAHHLVQGDDGWMRYMPQSVLQHVTATRSPLSCIPSSSSASPPSAWHADPWFASFTSPPAFHCLPVSSEQGGLYSVLFLLSSAACPPPTFLSPHFPGLQLLTAQLCGTHCNTTLLTRLELSTRQLEQSVATQVKALERELEERRRVEVELTEAKRAADHNAAVKSTFLNNMSHEIRTPLNAVLSAARLLASTPMSGEQSHYLSLISTSGKLLLSLIGDILDIGRIESGLMQMESRVFHLPDCIETAVHLCHQTAAQKGLDLAFVCEPSIPPCVEGDLTRVSQVLINLASNAIKFTETGYVMVNVRARDKGPLPLQTISPQPSAPSADSAQQRGTEAAASAEKETAAVSLSRAASVLSALPSISPSALFRSLSAPSRPTGSGPVSSASLSSSSALPSSASSFPVPLRRLVEIEVRVTDTGIGMSPAVQARLFQVFSQGDASIVRRHGGSGLGLVISQRLAERMNGRITVQSEAGMGSTFTFTFQAAATLPSIWHPLLRQQQQKEAEMAAAWPPSAAPPAPRPQPAGSLPASASFSSLSAAASSPSAPFASPSGSFPYAQTYSLSPTYSSLLFGKRCLIICPLAASTRAYQSLCSGYGMVVSSTTHIELAFPPSAEEEREEEQERRRLEEERGKRRLPLQRIIGRTATTALHSPLPSQSQYRRRDDTGTDSGSDREGGAGGGGGGAGSGKDSPRRLSSRLTLIVPALSVPSSASSAAAAVPPSSSSSSLLPDVILIVSQPQWEHERQRELSRLIRALNVKAEQQQAASEQLSSASSAAGSGSAPDTERGQQSSDAVVRAEAEERRRKRKREAGEQGDEDEDEQEETRRRKRQSSGRRKGSVQPGGVERGKAVIVEIRTPAKMAFMLKAMAKMLIKRDGDAEERRAAERGGGGRADSGDRQTAAASESAQPALTPQEARGDADGSLDEEDEEVQIDEMEDDDAVPEETEQQRRRSHYRHHDPLPPLSDALFSSSPTMPPSLPSSPPPPPSLPAPPLLSVSTSPSSPSSPLLTKPVKPSSSRTRPSPDRLQLPAASTAAASFSTSLSSLSSSSSSSSSASGALPYLLREYSPTSMSRARPVLSISPIAGLYPLRILLAEDNHINVRLMLMLLGKLGYAQVAVAYNGQEVLAAIRSTAGGFDLVLMDCAMPVMDGLEATAAIRADPSLPAHCQPCIVALTANVHSDCQRECERAGMDAFLKKPVSCEQLSQQIMQAWSCQKERRSKADRDGKPDATAAVSQQQQAV